MFNLERSIRSMSVSPTDTPSCNPTSISRARHHISLCHVGRSRSGDALENRLLHTALAHRLVRHHAKLRFSRRRPWTANSPAAPPTTICPPTHSSRETVNPGSPQTPRHGCAPSSTTPRPPYCTTRLRHELSPVLARGGGPSHYDTGANENV